MKQKVLDIITKYNLIESGDRLVLGVSGGPDSICMLHLLNELKNNELKNLNFNIVVSHINHKIREEADEEEEFVKKNCEILGIEFYSKSIDIKKYGKYNKIGTEEAGRIVRYDFFDEILEKTKSNKIAIAHNLNDKIETIIMNILRGSGISGIKGIQSMTATKYIRPLIECQRYEIENYCEENNLSTRIDKSNFDNIYTRNKIRNVVVPYIKQEFNPNIIETINRLSDLVKEEDEYIENEVKSKYKNMVLEENMKKIILDLKKFNNEEKVIKSRIIIYTITRLLGSSRGIEKIHIEDVIKLCSKNIGNKYLTPNKNIKILVKTNKIYFISQV